MPFLNLFLGKNVEESQKNKVISSLSKIIAESLGKPQEYMMVSISETKIIMAGSTEPAAFADLRSIGGINAKSTKLLSQKICSFLHDELAIAENRIYCNFTDIPAQNWGWNGNTF